MKYENEDEINTDVSAAGSAAACVFTVIFMVVTTVTAAEAAAAPPLEAEASVLISCSFSYFILSWGCQQNVVTFENPCFLVNYKPLAEMSSFF